MTDDRLLFQKMKSVIFCRLYIKKNRGLNWANFTICEDLEKRPCLGIMMQGAQLRLSPDEIY